MDAAIWRDRRSRLGRSLTGTIVLLGNGDRPRNLILNPVKFRQDSTFLYFTGVTVPDAAVVIRGDTCIAYLPPIDPDDALWHGHATPWEAVADHHGFDAIRSIHDLRSDLDQAGTVRTLAVSDSAAHRHVTGLCGPLTFSRDHGDDELVDAVIAQRRGKSAAELEAMRTCATASAHAHRAAMAATRPGVHENTLAAWFRARLAAAGLDEAYGTILTQRGDILHHRGHEARLEAGRLLLLDGGGESPATGHGADITRAWPVNGRFSGRQRAAYEGVLAAQEAAIARCQIGTSYRTVHDVAALTLARWLVDEGLLFGDPESLAERGAHAVFFPHGTGHLIGLDVHDLENFGDRAAYAAGAARSPQFGTRYLRLDLPLEAGWVVTVEPGFYVVDSILNDARLRETFANDVAWEAAEAWAGFGGIRIEDDVAIGINGPDILSAAAPKTVSDVEALVGTGPDIEALLCGRWS